ncbi:MAG: amidohydrolase family protein, partial [Candidatus Kariarchaeaceae archaeon]
MPESENGKLIIEGGTVFDSIKGEMLPDTSIIIADKAIQWIGPTSSVDKSQNDTTINADGKYILPGLINCHVHLELDFEANWQEYALANRSVQYAYDALSNAQTYLKFGFTTVRDCGGSNDWGSSLRRSLENNLFNGPRLIISGKPMHQYGQYEITGKDHYRSVDVLDREIISGAEGAMHAVRERKAQGSDFIKLLLTGAVTFGEGSDLNLSYWTDDEITAIVSEAERLGSYVSAHAHGDMGVQRGIDGGVRSIEHGMLMEESTAKRMAEKGTFLVLTETVVMGMSTEENKAKMPKFMRDRMAHVSTKLKAAHQAAYYAGVKIALGTDYIHSHTPKEFEFMVNNVGMSIPDALKAGTAVGAELIRLDDKIGSLETGKLADLVIVGANPLNDVTSLQNLEN